MQSDNDRTLTFASFPMEIDSYGRVFLSCLIKPKISMIKVLTRRGEILPIVLKKSLKNASE